MISFSDHTNGELVAWKLRTPTLEALDRAAAPYSKSPAGKAYDVCLPLDFAEYNLLPDARRAALDRFASLGIRWHDGVGAGPSNHLRSSQVQCVNALMPFVTEPASLKALLRGVLPIEQVVQFDDPGAPEDHVVFEWIGLTDYLNEGNGKRRSRGANTTSSDAAIKYRTPDGETEIALIEWKYTESYPSPHPKPNDPSNATRRARYESLWGSVVRTDLLELDDLFVEPFYQLLRQQMLAHEMERNAELGAQRVRLVYAAPARNRALWSSLPTQKLRDLQLPTTGKATSDVRELWDALPLEDDRFAWLDTASFVAAGAPTSVEFKDRYAHIAAPSDSI
jgi:hypothetical protein